MNHSSTSPPFALTHGALLSTITNGIENTIKPVVQIIHCQPLTTPTPDGILGRYKLIISDGKYFMPCVTHEQLCIHFTEGTLKKNTIIELEEYTLQQLNNDERTYCLGIYKITAHDSAVTTRIGKPKNILREVNKSSVEKSNKTETSV